MSEPTTTSSISVAVTNSVSGTYINRNVKPFDPTQPHQTPAMTAFNTSLDKFRSNPKFVVKEITPIAVSPFGPLGKAKAGFGYVHANVQYSKIKNPTTGAPVTVPGLALVRGGSVTILTFLHCNGIDYVILTEQPRIPIGEPEYLEAPAGMQDGNNNFIGVAANEMGQEVGLTNLGSTDFKYLCKFFPSAGGTDESMIELFMRVKCDKTVLDYLNGHLAGAIEENEQITVRIRPLSEVRSQIRTGILTDAKLMVGLLHYLESPELHKWSCDRQLVMGDDGKPHMVDVVAPTVSWLGAFWKWMFP